VFAFPSLLISRRVFYIDEYGFLSMGYTHEDINGTYRRSLAQIKKKDIFSLLQMVKTYRCEDHNFFISYLIHEFFDLQKLHGSTLVGK
jgi:hypothetical protein